MEEAIEWLSKALEAGLIRDIIIYNAVIDACAKSGCMKNVADGSSKARDAGLKLNIITYSAVIEDSAKFGDMEEAVEWFQKLYIIHYLYHHLGEQERQNEPRWLQSGCKIEPRWDPGLRVRGLEGSGEVLGVSWRPF